MSRVAEMYLAGRYTQGAADWTVAVHSPVTGGHLADLPVPTQTDIDHVVRAARRALLEYQGWSAYEWAELCHRIARLIESNLDELARLTTLEQGKPLAEARGDVEDSADLFATSGEDAKRLYGSTIPSSEREKRMWTYRRPVGVWAAITPWNFPLMIM